jgi:nucleoporin GLE1
MAGSSPTGRRGYQWSSPQQSVLSDILYEDRNSEARHKLLLETAKREHERVRAEAERVYRDHFQKEERQRLLDAERKEEERIRLEEQIAAKRRSLQALRAKKVDIPPLPEPEPERAAPTTQPATTKPSEASPASVGLAARNGPLSRPPTGLDGVATQKPAPPPSAQPAAPNPFAPTKPNPFARASPASASPAIQLPPPQPPAAAANPFARTPSAPQQTNGTAASQVTRPPSTQGVARQPDRYLVIHGNLKALRKSLDQQIATNRELKSRMGDMRREVRKTVGQLTTGTGANRGQVGLPLHKQVNHFLCTNLSYRLIG